MRCVLFALLLVGPLLVLPTRAADEITLPGRWSAEKAQQWHANQPWLVGANFVPSSAINQLEMWQADSFDEATIDRELGYAAGIGMNTMRVFLHDLPWQQDSDGYCERIDRFLELCRKHGIRPMLVIFDSVWHPLPKLGTQPLPTPGVHNSGWVQSPGKAILSDPARHDELKAYVQGVIRRFGDDPRVLAWDLYNEPDNANNGKWGGTAAQDLPPREKHDRACQLMQKAFAWAREVNPSQPLTIGVWGRPKWLTEPSRMDRIALQNSDVISFHTYDGPDVAAGVIEDLVKSQDRPLLCTEYMARGNNSTFEGILPLFQRHRIAAYNWGLVDGKSQTIYPWDSWTKKYASEPDPWFHDVFRHDGTPYRTAEVDLIRRLTQELNGAAPPPAEKLAPLPVAEIRAGINRHDRALHIKDGWIRDPYIVIGPDDKYYLTGTTPQADDPREVADPYNTGLGERSLVGWQARVWRSDDLASWESLGPVFTLRDGIWHEQRQGRFDDTAAAQWHLWAPELHVVGERWALVHTSPFPVRASNLVLSQGSALKGPWTSPMGTEIAHRHDPSLFRDDDGTWYLVWGATEVAPLKPDFSGFAAEPVTIGPSGEFAKMGHEGCLIRKVEGKYLLFGTGWSTGTMRKGSYNLYFAVADKVTGPYGVRQFVGRFLGHGTPFQDKQGRWWCTAFYNGNVPPIASDEIATRDLAETAQTINQQGTTIVPLEIRSNERGEIEIRPKDPRYAVPGPDEAQKFPLLTTNPTSS